MELVFYNGFSDSLALKIFTQDGVMRNSVLADKVLVDRNQPVGENGVLQMLNKVETYGEVLVDGEDEINGQVIRVKFNKDNEIKEIDTEYVSESESRVCLQRTVDYVENVKNWYYADSFPDQGVYYDGNTVRFTVPVYGEMETAEDEDYFIKTGKHNEDSVYRIEAFKINLENGYADVVVNFMKGGAEGLTLNEIPYLVESKGEELNADEELIDTVNAYMTSGGAVVKLVSESDGVFENVDKGDLIRVRVNDKGEVAEVEVLYDYDKKTSKGFGHLTNGGTWRQSNQYYDIVHSYVKTAKDGLLRLVYDKSGNNWPISETNMTPLTINNCDRMVKFSTGGSLLIYDSERDRIISSTLENELRGADVTGVASAEDYWLIVFLTNVASGVVYR